MTRGDGSIYARFKDSPEPRNANVPKEGNLELVENGSTVNMSDIENQAVSIKVLTAAVRKIYICLLTICIVVTVLLVFTATNFVLIIKSRNKIVQHKSTQDTTGTQYHIQVRDEVELNPLDPLSKDFMTSDHRCEVYIGPTCYWLANGKMNNFKQSLESCKIAGGDPGVVHNSNYQSILEYIRQKAEQDTSSAWLGMTRDSGTGEIKTTNHGKFEDSLHWLPGYPSTARDATNLCLQADKNVNSTNNGFLNLNPESRGEVQSILCEMPWNDGGDTQQGDYDYTTDSPSNSTDF